MNSRGLQSFPQQLYKDQVDEAVVQVMQALLSNPDPRQNNAMVQEKFFANAQLLLPPTATPVQAAAHRLFYLCVNAFLYPKDISVSDCETILKEQSHIHRNPHIQPVAFTFIQQTLPNGVIPNASESATTINEAFLLLQDQVFLKTICPPLNSTLTQALIDQIKDIALVVGRLGLKEVTWELVFSAIHKVHSYAIVSYYVSSQSTLSRSNSAAVKHKEDLSNRALKGAARMHIMQSMLHRPVDIILADCLKKMLPTDDIISKTTVRQSFVKQLLEYSRKLRNQDKIAVIADRILIVIAEAILFPINVRSSLIYNLTQIIHDQVDFGYHQSQPRVDYIEESVQASEIQIKQAIQSFKNSDQSNHLFSTVLSDSDILKLNAIVVEFASQVDVSKPFGSVGPVYEGLEDLLGIISWTQKLIDHVHRVREEQMAKEVAIVKTVTVTKPKHQEILKFDKQDLTEMSHNNKRILSNLRGFRGSYIKEDFASNLFVPQQEEDANAIEESIRIALQEFAYRSVLDPSLMVFGQFIGHHNQALQKINQGTSPPVVPIVPSSLFTKLIGIHNSPDLLYSMQGQQDIGKHKLIAVQDYAQQFTDSYYDTLYQKALQILNRQPGKIFPLFDETPVPISLNPQKVEYIKPSIPKIIEDIALKSPNMTRIYSIVKQLIKQNGVIDDIDNGSRLGEPIRMNGNRNPALFGDNPHIACFKHILRLYIASNSDKRDMGLFQRFYLDMPKFLNAEDAIQLASIFKHYAILKVGDTIDTAYQSLSEDEAYRDYLERFRIYLNTKYSTFIQYLIEDPDSHQEWESTDSKYSFIFKKYKDPILKYSETIPDLAKANFRDNRPQVYQHIFNCLQRSLDTPLDLQQPIHIPPRNIKLVEFKVLNPNQMIVISEDSLTNTYIRPDNVVSHPTRLQNDITQLVLQFITDISDESSPRYQILKVYLPGIKAIDYESIKTYLQNTLPNTKQAIILSIRYLMKELLKMDTLNRQIIANAIRLDILKISQNIFEIEQSKDDLKQQCNIRYITSSDVIYNFQGCLQLFNYQYAYYFYECLLQELLNDQSFKISKFVERGAFDKTFLYDLLQITSKYAKMPIDHLNERPQMLEHFKDLLEDMIYTFIDQPAAQLQP